MSKLIQASKLIVVFSILIAGFFIVGYASIPVVSAADGEEWVGTVAGMAEGDLKLFITPTGGEGEDSVRGKLTMDLDMTEGGYGCATATCSIKGKITNGTLKGKISGFAQASLGSSSIVGELNGTISETRISGTWIAHHVAGTHSGTWTAEKVQ
jgi:hypothetical protein